ncbi:TerB N-terminal domain-containing protein [Paenibacillus tengchongensis]|uniref:TerB N-terminal domain-containing protein n=1 Tax=Paenibacillus tengchongensis TaxID=2608684 RepID=UPI00124CFE03|nr:TerB N-terminal domain-containing protein [Paenibacillus tengchongensis]
MKNDGREPHFAELVWENTEHNLPIPSREDDRAQVPQAAVTEREKKAAEPAVQLQLWDMETKTEPVTTTESQFVVRARELADHKEPAALFVPFKSYWPTYGHMTGAQSRWYFFWRDEARAGNYLKTDLSYIFLHVYELINGVGWDVPEEGLRQLWELWEAYREQFKRLDQYLGGWIADFSFVHKLDIPLSRIIARSRGLAGDLAELELMRCLTGASEQLTFDALTVMSDYDISKSKFYAGEGKEALEKYIPMVVALIDAYVKRKHGQTLLEMFPPGPAIPRERYLFRSAVYDISLYGYSVLVPVVRISKSPPLRSLVTRLFRLTENKLRELLGFRGRLKDVRVDADMEELVTRFLRNEFRKAEQANKGPAVVIDREKLERLQSDSEMVRSLLTVEDTEPEALSEGGAEVQAAESLPAMAAEHPITIDEVSGKVLSGTGAAPAGGSPEVTGVTAVTGDPAAVPSDPAAVSAGPANLAAVDETPAEAGDPAWSGFVTSLTSLQREVILAVAEENLSAAERIAAAAGTMTELLFDEINGLAMDWLGDLLIDNEAVNEEWLPMLQSMKR